MHTKRGPIWPNVYCILVAYPGVGKTVTIEEAERYYMQTPEPHKAPTSLTGSSLVDAMKKNQRIVRGKDIDLDYNSMFITADELTAFMHKYDDEVIGIMSQFYGPREYAQWRRGNELRLKIERPQLNVLCGSTPSNLMNLMPENAWEQGFTSRFVLVFSDERINNDDFSTGSSNHINDDMVHDLRIISSLIGDFKVTDEYREAVNLWREAGEPPTPTHPKLMHYTTRRRVHLYKLSMVSAVDRGDVLLLTKSDFERALGWLVEAESTMGDIFKAGGQSADSQAIDEIHHYVLTHCIGGKTIPGYKIVNFAKARIPLHSVERVIGIMEKSGLIKQAGLDPKNKNMVLYLPSVPDGGSDD